MVTQAQRVGASQVICKDPLAKLFLTDTYRDVVLESTLKHFDPRLPPSVIIKRVKQDLKGVIPFVLIAAVIGWIVQRLLDYLWDTYTFLPPTPTCKVERTEMPAPKATAMIKSLPAPDQEKIKALVGATKTSDLSEVLKKINLGDWAKRLLLPALELIESLVVPKVKEVNPTMAVILQMILDGLEDAVRT